MPGNARPFKLPFNAVILVPNTYIPSYNHARSATCDKGWAEDSAGSEEGMSFRDL